MHGFEVITICGCSYSSGAREVLMPIMVLGALLVAMMPVLALRIRTIPAPASGLSAQVMLPRRPVSHLALGLLSALAAASMLFALMRLAARTLLPVDAVIALAGALWLVARRFRRR